jgi:membrane associated rhomboid family serine protease
MNVAAVGHQCPECVSEGRKAQRPVRTAFGGSTAGAHGYVTIGLIVVNCLMLLASVVSARSPGGALFGSGFGGIMGSDTPLLDHLGILGDASYTPGGAAHGIAAGEYYRLVTAMFMHYGLIHLALNMYSLWILGRPLEALLGPVRFLAIYQVCGLGGGVAAYVFSKPYALTAGASTAIFGLFGAFFVVLRRLRLNANQMIPIIVINIVFTLSVPGISVAGHFGGLITGFLVGAGIAYAPRNNRTLIQVATVVVALAVLAGLTVYQTAQLS